MNEFGVFTDEGCLADGFYSKTEAEEWMASNCEHGEARVAETCPEHPENERESCETCLRGDGEE